MTTPAYDALDDFAGPGGWDEGARMIGLKTIGIDHDKAACATAAAAGHARILHDVTTHDSTPWCGICGYIASPSCTLFSPAGKGTGRGALGILCDAVVRIFNGDDCRAETRDRVYTEVMLPARIAENDDRPTAKQKTYAEVEQAARTDATIACLVLEPARRIMELDPEWIALEQVASVLPVWEVYARCLRARGYSVFALVLCAADYGVPQLRYRAVCGASRVRTIGPPPPTHTANPEGDDLFGGGLLPHVCMADALGWPLDATVKEIRGKGRTERHGDRPARPATRPAPTLTSKVGEWVVDRRTNSKDGRGGMVPTVTVPVTRPAPTLTGQSGSQWVVRPRWPFERPATTIVGSFKPEVVSAPGYRTTVSRQNAEGSVTITVAEAGILQSFPPDYPWQGSKGKQHEQAGNAVPPLLAAHVLAAITGRQAPA